MNTLKVVGVIPARFKATRFPGKPLALILGKPMILHVLDQVSKAKSLNDFWVATDDARIAEVVHKAGYKFVMTSEEAPSGSDRIYESLKNNTADLVINIQGDEPMVDPEAIDLLVTVMQRNPQSQMGTLAHSIEPNEIDNPNIVKVILNNQSEAIYFSRFPLPYSKMTPEERRQLPSPVPGVFRHVGMYAYKFNFLKKYCEAQVDVLEKAESLEQLRALGLGARIQVALISKLTIGVDTEEDLKLVERILSDAQKNKGN